MSHAAVEELLTSDPLPSWSLQPGEHVVPDCTVQRLLGGGTSYEAYLAFDERRLTSVVIKVVRPHLVDDASTLRGLDREISVVGRLAHPMIVRGFHADPTGSRPYIALEHLHGPSLSQLVRRHGPVALEQVVPLTMQMASALHYLHECGYVHLDVKPSNIIMDATPRLIDLSIARTLTEAISLDHVTGTDRYLAPEQARPQTLGQPGPASDVWGLGATLFHAISGRRPFPDGSGQPTDAHEQRWPQITTAPAPLPPDVPAALADLVFACLAVHPEDRPSARDVFNALDPIIGRLPKPRLTPVRFR